MTNPVAPFGLRANNSLGHMNSQINQYAHDAGDAVALFTNDPVITTGVGTTGQSANALPDGTPICAASGTVTTGSIRGAVAQCCPQYSNLALQYCPASTELEIWVHDDPNQLFEIQSDGTVSASGDISNNVSLLTGTGSTVTGLSLYQAHQATLGSTEVLRIIRLSNTVGNALSLNGVYTVKISNHELNLTAGT